MTGAPCLRIEPLVSRVDEQMRITVAGARPHSPVTLTASATDHAGIRWESWARFSAGPRGTVDVAAQRPDHGSYSGADWSGLLWSMRPPGKAPYRFFAYHRTDPVTISVTAAVAGGTAQQELTRTFGDPVTCRPADAAIAGTLFLPAHPGSWPAVLLLGGSDGAPLDRAAALLARRGYAVLSLSYFGSEGLPGELAGIDLDYFGVAMRWLAAQPEAAGPGVAVVGLSRGAELALQLGATFPAVRAVVAGSPSSARQPGLGRDWDFSRPAWLKHGCPLPFLPVRPTPRVLAGFAAAWLLRRPVRQRAMFLRAMGNQAAADRAAIEVERIRGPVLLISGTDDQLWPSEEFARQIMARLRRHGHPYEDDHLSYQGAGHLACFPYGLPSLPPMTVLPVTRSVSMAFGGTAAANARAAASSWLAVTRFLARAAPRASGGDAG